MYSNKNKILSGLYTPTIMSPDGSSHQVSPKNNQRKAFASNFETSQDLERFLTYSNNFNYYKIRSGTRVRDFGRTNLKQVVKEPNDFDSIYSP
jgi:hypothetical protein